MSHYRHLLAVSAIFGASLCYAGSDFGTRAEAEELAHAVIEIVENDGIAAAVTAIIDPDGPFRHSRMGINLFGGSFVIADNREPETVAADYSETADLTGQLVWPIISAAADAQDDAVLLWYHYDTQEHYTYHCFSLRADRDDGTVMVCR